MTNTAMPRPKPFKLGAEKLTPEEQKRRFAELCDCLDGDEVEAASMPKPTGKNGAPLSPAEQRRRFEEAACELGCDQSEVRFNEALDVIEKRRDRPAE